MADQPGLSRYCHKYKESVVEWGDSGLSLDCIRRVLKHAEKQPDNHGAVRYYPNLKLGGSYPGSCTYPPVQLPFEHDVELMNGQWRLPNQNPSYAATQTLKLKDGRVLVTSQIVPNHESVLDSNYIAYVRRTYASVASSFRPETILGDFWLCPHVPVDVKMKIIPVLDFTRMLPELERPSYYSTCTFCQAKITLSLNENEVPTITVEKDLGTLDNNQDPSWLRHTSQRVYRASMVNGVEELSLKKGKHFWEGLAYKITRRFKIHWGSYPLTNDFHKDALDVRRSSHRLARKSRNGKKNHTGSRWEETPAPNPRGLRTT